MIVYVGNQRISKDEFLELIGKFSKTLAHDTNMQVNSIPTHQK